MMSESELDELTSDIREHGLIEPIVFWADNTAQKESGQHWGLEHCPKYLLDGRSRLEALGRLGLSLDDVRCATKRPSDPFRIIPAWKRQPLPGGAIGSWPWRYLDPWAYVLSVNVRRRHLTQAQKRQVVESVLRRRPDLTDRALAKLAGFDHKTAAARRAAAEASGEIPRILPAERIEADGRRARARKTTTPAAEPDWDSIVRPDWRPPKNLRFLSPVKWNAPKRARIVAALGYLDHLDLSVDELVDAATLFRRAAR